MTYKVSSGTLNLCSRTHCRYDPQTLYGNVHQVDHVPNGPTNSAVTTTMFPLRLCGGKPSVAVTRERHYGRSRLRVNDDDEIRQWATVCV